MVNFNGIRCINFIYEYCYVYFVFMHLVCLEWTKIRIYLTNIKAVNKSDNNKLHSAQIEHANYKTSSDY